MDTRAFRNLRATFDGVEILDDGDERRAALEPGVIRPVVAAHGRVSTGQIAVTLDDKHLAASRRADEFERHGLIRRGCAGVSIGAANDAEARR